MILNIEIGMIKNIKRIAFTICTVFCCTCSFAKIQVTVTQPIVPVLTQKSHNPVLKVSFIKDSASNCFVKDMTLFLEGAIGDIHSIGLYASDNKGLLDATALLTTIKKAEKKVTFSNPLILTQDTTDVWVSVTLHPNINLTHKYRISCHNIKVKEQDVEMQSVRPLAFLRAGVAMRKNNQDNIHTSRIPGIATSKNKTLLAIYDARYESSRDLQGNIDIALNRSHNGGITWAPTQIVLDMKEWGNLPEKYNGVSDACILVDEKTGAIYVAGLWMHGVLDAHSGKWVEGLTKDSTRWIHQWIAKGTQPGLDVKETCQFLITKSTDDGMTWSDPVNITSTTKRPKWWLFAPAPGHGIILRDGTLIFPSQGRDKNGIPFSNITYSLDGGKTWQTSNPAYHNTTECMAVELSNGSIMLNMRDNRNHGTLKGNGRRICVTNDLGKSWREHPTSRNALVEPTCMASIHKHQYTCKGKQKTLLLFCNPASHNKRDHMTLKASFDDGNTWPSEHHILLDEWAGFGYSCITSVDENTIGILYEGSQAQMVFQQISLNEIIGCLK